MEPIKRGELQGIIEFACVIRLDTYETRELSAKGDSFCHFFEPIIIGGYKVILRLDWSDLDEDGHPTLDADFYDIESNKKLPNRGERRAAHHTNTVNSKRRVYEWVFRNIKWPFKVVVRWLLTSNDEFQLSDEATCEVYRNCVRLDE